MGSKINGRFPCGLMKHIKTITYTLYADQKTRPEIKARNT